ncbi:DUF1080 domain-containing protein [Tamlana fucoidanivorans]|uniref:DUF1080 domain-containing protein n=1 Tax=Allotamlana fucoidanivorans TaxID=2583814 RepID=A0A5C4SP24_9FLAO|nr:DUF1080 domain-containing protein [Tamlana fucoidanivorans]TNJ46028.1 DUF1080 domain-containing protein [Tamlana fucoidanivorans]
MKRIIFFLILMMSISVFTFCSDKTKKENTEIKNVKRIDRTNNWITLFDGKTADGWRGFNSEELPKNWIVENGTLKSLGKGGDIGGDIVFADEQFENFELKLEWKIETGGNSGIFYHVQEGDQYSAPYQNAPEYQIIDQRGFPEKLEPWQSIAADYGMHNTDKNQLIVKTAGEWNTTRIIFTKERVEHWLNGKKVLEFEPWSKEWIKKKESGKWKDFPEYGIFKKGLIGLQDHGSLIWFRNIKIRKL